MSFNVDVSVWLGEEWQLEPLKVLGQTLTSINTLNHLLADGSTHHRFAHLRVFAKQSSNILVDEAIGTNEVSIVLEKARAYSEPDVHYKVASAFDYFRYADHPPYLEPTVGPLDIHYYGPQYGWQGHYYKRFGPVRISFSNTKSFQVSKKLFRKIKEATTARRSPIEGLQRIADLNHNFDVVNELARKLIQRLDPLHLIVCTEGEIHPLTAHAIYHKNWRDYLTDLVKIARLHEYGGGYYCDVSPGEPAFMEARKLLRDYGYIKYWGETQDQFLETLQPLVDAVLREPEKIQNVTREQIEECFYNSEDLELEEVNDTYYLCAGDAPFAYLDEIYIDLISAIYGGDVQNRRN